MSKLFTLLRVAPTKSNTVAPRCNESQEFRFFGELSFVTARFWKKFLIARSVWEQGCKFIQDSFLIARFQYKEFRYSEVRL